MPYDGDVLLADAMFVGGAVTGAAVTAVNPPVACLAGNTTQLPFTCVTHLSLMPGEEHLHWVDVTMPAPGGYWAQNCFGALDPSLFPVGPVPPGLGGGGPGVGNPSCVWVHVPVPAPNLKLVKTALHGGKCAKVGTDLLCDYEIKLTNENNVLFTGPVKIEETVPAGATIQSASAPWACAGGPPSYTCDTGAAVNIAADGSTAFNVTVKIPVAVSEASFCVVPNKAKIQTPIGGVAPNIDATDDMSSADAWTLGLFWEDPITHITFIMCDPTNLKVAKAAKGPCKPSGGDFTCDYEVTVTNTGPDPYKGPVKLDEKFGAAPVSVTFGGDFTCNGGGANYNCETPVVALANGASLTLTVNAKVPASSVCALPNTATMTFPPVGSKGNGKGDDDSASATASVPSPKCGAIETLLPLPPTLNRCPDGLPVPRSGKCPCTDGGTWSRVSNSCENGEPKQPEGCAPGVNEIKTDSGRCICREGYTREDGRCVSDKDEPQACQPGPHEFKTKSGRCMCAEGYRRVPNGECRPEPNDEPQGCSPGPHEAKLGNGRCVCDDSYSRNGNGLCIHDRSPEDDCRNDGGKWTGVRCVHPQKECPDGTSGNYPNCKRDIPDPPKVPKKCGADQRGIYPNCVDIPQHCPRGMLGTPGNCHSPKPPKDDPPPKKCPRGMLGSNGDCYWPKPPKDDPPPKHKIPEIFKQKPRSNDGPVIQKQGPGSNFKPEMFKKFD